MLGAILLIVFSMIAFLAGIVVFALSKSVLHEMLAGILIVISAIYFTGALIIAEIGSSKTKQIELLNQICDELRNLRLKKYPEKRPDEGMGSSGL